FKKTHTRAYSKSASKATTDTTYWRKLEFPVTVKEFTSIDYVDVCPVEPYYIAVTSGPKIDIYNKQTAQVWKTLSRFQRLAYGGKFKQDGQLLLAGSEEGVVKLFNYRQKQLLRLFKGHEGPTHRVDFIQGLPHIVTFSDDKTAIVWDMSDESKLCTLSGHTDFLRAGIASPASENMILTGSYDHTVKLWDTRTATSVLTVDHGAPVESLVCFPSGGVFVSAGGCEINVWDAIAGRLLAKLSQHHKTVTCLSFATDKKRLMSGSLDRHVKIYDIDTYSPGDSTLVVGMISAGSGLLSFQHRRSPETTAPVLSKRKVANIRNTVTDEFVVMPNDQVVHHLEREKVAKYDRMMCRFEYSRALDAVLTSYTAQKTTNVSVGVMQELIRRRGIKTAVAGREVKTLKPLLYFVLKNIRHPAYKKVLMDVANVIIDIYGDTLDENPGLVKHFMQLKEEVAAEMRVAREHISLMGAIQMFLTASNPERAPAMTSIQQLTATSTLHYNDVHKALQPSSSAKSAPTVVVDVS
ncbi:U3 small nucleolar RNA-associated protein 15-like, partial [Homarus americanus]